MNKLLFTLLPLLFAPLIAFTQITGKIIDSKDGSSLPFATIIGPSNYAIANEEGEFTYRGGVGDKLAISFLGYKDTIVYASEQMIIKMQNDGLLSETIVITDENYISPYELIIKTKKQYKKLKHKVIPSKLFVKRQTINNGEWSDQTETLYNAKQYKGKIYDLAYQHGKSYINDENDVIFTLDLLTVLQDEEIFSKYSKYLYTSACSEKSEKKIKSRYEGDYKEWQSNDKNYFIIDTKSKKENKFNTTLTIGQEDFDLVKLQQHIVNPSETSFYSVRTKESIDIDSLSLDYLFEEWNGIKVISSMNVTYSYLLNGVHSKNIINLKFFDFDNPYSDLITSIDYNALTDYQRIWNTPYNDAFWNGQKLTFSKLDTLSDYNYFLQQKSNLLPKKRYLTVDEIKTIGLDHFVHIPRMDDGAGLMLKYDQLDMKSQRHVHAHFFAHLYEVDNESHVNLAALIDHQRSFILKRTPMMDTLFVKELKVVTTLEQELNLELETLNLDEDDAYKKVFDLIKSYNKRLTSILSTMDKHQNKDWAAKSARLPSHYNTKTRRFRY